jgi:hypothetical protein
MFLEVIYLISGAYLLILGTQMETGNLISAFYFNVLPLVLGVLLMFEPIKFVLNLIN